MNGADRRARRRSRRFLVALAAAALLVLAGHALHGLRVTYDLAAGRWHDAAEATDRHQRCLREQVESAVPRGATLSVDPALGDELWQRSLEAAWGAGAELVTPGRPAELTLTTGPAGLADPCGGEVVATRPGPLPATTPTAPTTAPPSSAGASGEAGARPAARGR
jgi:hypothetical protein